MTELTLEELKAFIKRRKRQGKALGLLGLVENRDLSREVEQLFTFKNDFGQVVGYDWVNGNDKLKELIETI